MKIQVDKKALAGALSLVARAVEKRTTIPILTHLLIRVRDGALQFTATDLNVAIVTAIPAERFLIHSTEDCPAEFCVPATRLLNYISSLPDGDVTLTADENFHVTVTAGKSRTRIPGQSTESFPVLPAAPAGGDPIATDALLGMLRRTSFAISQEESRFTLNGVLFKRSADQVEIVATDGHQLVWAREIMPGEPTQFILPTPAIKALPALMGDRVHVAQDENHLFFTADNATLICRKLAGNFPDYERALPRGELNRVMIGRAEFGAAVRRVAQFADERSHAVKLTFSPTGLDISASSVDFGESSDTVSATGAPDLEVSFNADYLAEFCGVADVEAVEFHIRDAKSSAELRPAGSDNYRYVVMPMRIG